MKNQLTQFAARGRVLLQRLVRPLGFVLLPITEIERMEREATSDRAAMRRQPEHDFDRGYFCGLADYGSRKAEHLRAVCGLPNDQFGEPTGTPRKL